MVNITPPKLKDQPRPFFLDVLRDRVAAEGGYRKLALAITLAYRTNMVSPSSFDKEECIDRRKLTKLLEGDYRRVVLSVIELECLHAYLATLGQGLTREPFFRHSSIVQELAALRDAKFMLGSRMRREGPELSHWDIQAMVWMQRAVHDYSRTTFDLLEVPRSEKGDVKPNEKVERFVDANAMRSLILVGSERSNEATRLIFRSMLGMESNDEPEWSELPFYFVLFDEDDSRPVKGGLSRKVGEVPPRYASMKKDVKNGVGWGLVVGDESFVSQAATQVEKGGKHRVLQDEVRSHGVIAAQRQRDGQIYITVAGLTGPGTLGAASKLSAMPGVLPARSEEQRGAVLWGVVETVVDTRPMKRGGQADLGEPEFVVGPRIWHPKQRLAM